MKNLSNTLTNENMPTNTNMSISNNMPTLTPQTGMHQLDNNIMHTKTTDKDNQMTTNHQ